MNTTDKNMQTLAAQTLAADIAREMHEDHFDSHRGSGVVEGHGLLYFYDNHPYVDAARRPREHEEIHAFLATKGATLVASASWPLDGEQPGYTVAHVYACDEPEEAERAISDRYREIVVGELRAIN